MTEDTPAFEHLRLEETSERVATLVIDRSEALNALNEELLDELEYAARWIAGREDLGALIVTGAGRAFVAGADIKSMADYGQNEALKFVERGHETMDAIAEIPIPTLAAIHGFALGGGLELALACDLLYAAEGARLGLPEVTLGIIPGFGGTQRLTRLIGPHAAREMIFTGDQYSAEDACAMGLVRRVFPEDGFLDAVGEVAETIASRGPLALREAKKVMRAGAEIPLDRANKLERNCFSVLFESNQPNEGMRAFLEKRSADFEGADEQQ
jgi:enoyl-CoA hydratase